jgi:hypothetical protein
MQARVADLRQIGPADRPGRSTRRIDDTKTP